ncbi:hypothetical protein [Arthrobacter sp. H35-D1]|uniref:hypothetical protein n=1 Tax=Arthrobacter sp. H35-D1 TaxID=3046202 RepID=UPI0024B90DB8|nr:hypothetical protein [Arthrobacter sp. H35-D1]MDJ0315352.1 hypothetical protein [Arthrobacter sp. H35-D1]
MNSFTEWEKLAVMSAVMVSTITWMKAVFGPEKYPEYFILEEVLLEDLIHRHLVYEQDGNCWVSHWLHGPTVAGVRPIQGLAADKDSAHRPSSVQRYLRSPALQATGQAHGHYSNYSYVLPRAGHHSSR